jgi:galactonate dehydratase
VLELRIVSVEPVLCDGGFRTWIFIKVVTDEGITGWGDASAWQFEGAIAAAVRYLARFVVGEDPTEIDRLYWLMWARTTRMLGGIAHIAIAGIDNALYDVKGKALGLPVHRLLGGRRRKRIRLYWSHCGTHRVFRPEIVGEKRIDSYKGIQKLGEEVVRKGFTALKTNIFNPEAPGNSGSGSYRSGFGVVPIDHQTIEDVVKLIKCFREGTGEDVDIMLDAACRFDVPSAIKLAKSLEPLGLLFLEEPIPPDDPDACLKVKSSSETPICMSEGLYSPNQYQLFLKKGAIDVAMPDISWVGLTTGMRIANLCDEYGISIAPHSPHSPLCTVITGHFSSCIPNFLIQEVEVDDVPWRDQVISKPLRIVDGSLELPKGPGFGVNIVEDEVDKHPVSV